MESNHSSNNSPFDTLPTPTLQHIISYFNKFDCFVTSLVCKRWTTLITRNQSVEIHELMFHFCGTGSLSVLKWLRDQTSLYKPLILSTYYAALKSATANGHFAIVRWLKENSSTSLDDDSLSIAAVKNNNLELCKWLYRNKCSFNFECLTEIAAKKGNLLLLQWLIEINCPVTTKTLSNAAGGGNFEILKWLRRNGYSWDEQACAKAAKIGNMKMLQWLRKWECPWDTFVCTNAALGGYFDILKWAVQQNCPWDVMTTQSAAKNGHFEILQWAVKQNCEIDEITFHNAAQFGSIEMLHFLLDKKCPTTSSAYDGAARKGKIEILDWLLKKKISKSNTACDAAAGAGQLEALKWLRDNHFPWSASTLASAYNNEFVFKWLRNNGCPWDESVIEKLVESDKPKLLEWALKRGCIASMGRCTKAIPHSTDCVKILYKWKYPLTKSTWRVAVEQICGTRILSWLLKNGCPVDKEATTTDEEIMEWLKAHDLLSTESL